MFLSLSFSPVLSSSSPTLSNLSITDLNSVKVENSVSDQNNHSNNSLVNSQQTRSTNTPHLPGQSLSSNGNTSLQNQIAQPLSASISTSIATQPVPQQTTVVNNHFLFQQQAAAVINNNSQNGPSDYFATAAAASASTMNPLLPYSNCTNSPSALTSSSSHYYPHQPFTTYQAHATYHPHHYPNTHFATNYPQLTHSHQINHAHSDILLKTPQW